MQLQDRKIEKTGDDLISIYDAPPRTRSNDNEPIGSAGLTTDDDAEPLYDSVWAPIEPVRKPYNLLSYRASQKKCPILRHIKDCST